MNIAQLFYEENYTLQKVLKSGMEGRTELVIGHDGLPYVRKVVNYEIPAFLELLQLEHIGLPKIYFASVIDGKTYVIEEYLSGVTLQECINNQRKFSAKDIEFLAIQLCDVLRFLHSRKIIHRDIKPSNIMLFNNSLYLKLLDFGTARKINDKDVDTNILGTPGYAPPEQFGFSSTDERSDIYALGKTLEKLLPENYNGNLRRVFARCTELDPKNRLSSVEAVKLMLQKNNDRVKIYFSFFFVMLLSISFYFYTYSQRAIIDRQRTIIDQQNKVSNNSDAEKRQAINDRQKKLNEKLSKIKSPQAEFARIHQKFIKTTNLITGEVSAKQPVPEWDVSLEVKNFQFWLPSESHVGNMRTPLCFVVYNNSDEPFVKPRIKIKFKGLIFKFNEKYKGKYSYPRHDVEDREIVTGIVFQPNSYNATEVEIQYNRTIKPHDVYNFNAIAMKVIFDTIDWKGDNRPAAEISLYGRDGKNIVVTSVVEAGMDDYRYR